MSEKLYQAIGEISEKHILEAEQYEAGVQMDPMRENGAFKRVFKGASGKVSWKTWGVVAACLVLLVAVQYVGREFNTTVIGGVERNYKNYGTTTTEIGIVWPKEYQTIYEQYNGMTFEGRGYRTRAQAIDTALLGEVLGTGTAHGYDVYTETTYTEEFQVRRILDVAPELLVAVGMEDQFYVYQQDEYAPPQTLGQMLETASLSKTLTLSRYSVYEGYTSKGYYRVEDDDHIWQILAECGDAVLVGERESDDWDWGMGERNYVSFIATSELLGIYKKVLYVTEDGYVKTNIFEYGYLFYIGEDPAREIISYAKDNATEAEFEPYEYRLAGKLTVIEDDYVLIDDSILCHKASEGMVFKVPMDDIRIRRCVEFGGLKVGDIVVVSFRGDIDVEAGNVIHGAVSMDKGFLSDGDVLVLE